MESKEILTGLWAAGLTCALVILGLQELTANPYSYSGTVTQTQPIARGR